MNQRFNKIQKTMVVSLIGRPNVGKSSLFNRLMRNQHKAITFDLPGVTRDRHYGVTALTDLRETGDPEMILVDTGGFFPEKVPLLGKNKEESFFNIMAEQAKIAVEESDLVLLVVDVREGPSPFDEMIARYLRMKKKTFWVLANKWDSESQAGLELDFFQLGIDPDVLFPISAAHSTGVETLRERLLEQEQKFQKELVSDDVVKSNLSLGVVPREEVVARVALIGAPNAGKSTFLNLLVGANRSLVSEIAGTTVDPIEGHFDLFFGPQASELDQYKKGHKSIDQVWSEFEKIETQTELAGSDDEGDDDQVEIETESDESEWRVEETDLVDDGPDEMADDQVPLNSEGQEPLSNSYWRSVALVDTAGIRRQRAVDGQIETQAVYQSLRSMGEADVVVLLVDATLGLSHQDRRLADIALEKGKSLLVVLNKVDLLKDKFKNAKAEQIWLEDLRKQIKWLQFVEMIPLSALKGQRLRAFKEALTRTILVRYREVPTGRLNKLLGNLTTAHPVVLNDARGKPIKVRYASQVKSTPPTFLLFCNKAQNIPDHYRRYLSNAIRREFKLINTPVHLIFRTGKEGTT